MPRPARSSSKLSAEERRLAKEQEALARKEQELKKKLSELPAKMEEKRSKERELTRIRVSAYPTAISLGHGRSSGGGRTSRKGPLPGREIQNARIKFLVLCLILATFVFLLWRTIPT